MYLSELRKSKMKEIKYYITLIGSTVFIHTNIYIVYKG